MTGVAINWAERGHIPDPVLRRGIRLLLKRRLASLALGDCETLADGENRFSDSMDKAVVAPLPEKANEQHYELPAEFFEQVLGTRRKYSCCLWGPDVDGLDSAEDAALATTCARAGIADDMDILELGCGWGSLTLWMAEHYPHSRITAVSNARSQGDYVRKQARNRGLENVRVVTRDMNDFDPGERFDRVVSVEMFEHMRNYRRLFGRIHDWLRPGGRFFMHIFCHRDASYEFEDAGANDWMSRYFFSGGIMPSDTLPLRFQDHLRLISHWRWNGRHYGQTAEAWLSNMDTRRENVWPLLEQAYGPEAAGIWWMRWRLFFMACAELFAYDGGQQWWVSHYLFQRQKEEG